MLKLRLSACHGARHGRAPRGPGPPGRPVLEKVPLASCRQDRQRGYRLPEPGALARGRSGMRPVCASDSRPIRVRRVDATR